MCLNDIDLAPFLSDSPPAPPDVWLEVTQGDVSVSGEAPHTSAEVFKAHRWGLGARSNPSIFNETC